MNTCICTYSSWSLPPPHLHSPRTHAHTLKYMYINAYINTCICTYSSWSLPPHSPPTGTLTRTSLFIRMSLLIGTYVSFHNLTRTIKYRHIHIYTYTCECTYSSWSLPPPPPNSSRTHAHTYTRTHTHTIKYMHIHTHLHVSVPTLLGLCHLCNLTLCSPAALPHTSSRCLHRSLRSSSRLCYFDVYRYR